MKPFVVLSLALLFPGNQTQAQAPTAQPGFSCKAAQSTVEKLICASQKLSSADASMSALYSLASKQAADKPALLEQQRQWLKQREVQCIRGKPLVQMKADLKTDTCLNTLYAQRIHTLRDLVTPPLQARSVYPLQFAINRQLHLDQQGCEIAQAALSGDGKTLALGTNCESSESALPDNQLREVWWVDLDKQVARLVVPKLGHGDPNGDNVFTDDPRLHWEKDTLHVRALMETQGRNKDDPAFWDAYYFNVKPGAKAQKLKQPSPAVLQQFEHPQGRYVDDAYSLIEDDGLLAQTIRQFGTRFFWLSDQGHGNIVLFTQLGEKTTDGWTLTGAAKEVTRGSWELQNILTDTQHLMLPSVDGILIYNVNTQRFQHIAGTDETSIPLAWLPGQKLIYSSLNGCGAKIPTKQRLLCTMQL